MVLFFIVFLIPLTGAGIDIHVPCLPAIQAFFAIDSTQAQSSVTLYIVGYGIGQLILGVLSDAFGRRIILLPFLLLYSLCNYAAVWYPDYEWFLMMRFFQGLSVAGIGIVAKAMVSDAHKGDRLRVATNYMTMGWATGLILSPVLGGYLQAYFDWKACFYFLAIYGLVFFILSLLFLPETINKKINIDRRLASLLWSVFAEPKFLTLTLAMGLGYGVLTLFNVIGPFLIEAELGYSAIDYGHIALVLGAAWFLGNGLNRYLSVRFHERPYYFSLMIMNILLSLTGLLVSQYHGLTVYALVLPSIGLLLFGGALFPNYYAKAYQLFPHIGGVLNALLGSMMLLICSSLTALGTLFKTHSATPLFLLYFLGSIMTLIVIRLFFHLSAVRT